MAGGGRRAAGGVGTPGRIPRSSPGAWVGMRGVLGVAAGVGCTLRRQKETAFATPLPVPLGTRGLRRANAAEEI